MLLIVGTVAFDTIETPFGSITNTLGGSGTFGGVSASYFTPSQLVAPIGEDFHEADIQLLNGKNIDTQGLQKLPGKTFRWGGKYSYDLNNRETLFTELNVLEQFKPQLNEEYKKAPFVFLGNFHPKLQTDVFKQLTRPKFVAMDTMNYWIETTPADLAETLQMVDCLIINDAEARELTQEHNIMKAAKAILKLIGGHDPLLVIKRGEYGLLMFQGDKFFNLPAYPLEDVMDPTGAGDSFAGGFMGYLTQSQDLSWENLKRACVAGSCLASFSVEKLGTERLHNLSPAEITARMESFKELTRFEIE